MNQPVDQPAKTVGFLCTGAMRCRSIGNTVLHGRIALNPLPARLLADWAHETSENLDLQLGDVELLPLARARTRWPDFRLCVSEASHWLVSQGLAADLLAATNIAVMACRGARCHHDGERYSGSAFFNVFVSDDIGLDLYFPNTGHRIALERGTAVVFDTYQLHAVVLRGTRIFEAEAFAPEVDWKQYFLTWELPIEDPALAHLLNIEFKLRLPCNPATR